MIDVVLSEYDSQIVRMYSLLYNTSRLSCEGKSWFISNENDTIEFKGYKGFIDFIEEEVKESLLTYALNGELMELVDLFSWH